MLRFIHSRTLRSLHTTIQDLHDRAETEKNHAACAEQHITLALQLLNESGELDRHTLRAALTHDLYDPATTHGEA